jgi:hypothetical protein
VYTGLVTVTGRVLAPTVVAPRGGAPDDTLSIDPVPGAVVRIALGGPTIEGEPGPTKVIAETTSDASGAFTFTGIPAGDYSLTAHAPAGSGRQDGWSYLSARRPSVSADLYLWSVP